MVPTKPRILPPVYLLASLLLMVLLHYFAPIVQLISPPFSYAGIVFVVIGIAITAVSAGAFIKAETPLVPFTKSTVVVTTGLFRYSRNPMYLGMVIALLGVAMLLGSIGSFVPIPVFVGIIHNLFIRREEIFLEDIFGDEYLAYRTTVRRWL